MSDDRSVYSEAGSYYAPPTDSHDGGVYRKIDRDAPRAERFSAHIMSGPFSGFGNKKSSRHSSSSHKDHHGSSRSSRSSTSSSSMYTSSSTRSQQQQQAQYQQQQFQQQQPRYPGPQPGYRPAGGSGYGPGYGPGVQQQRFAPQNGQPDIWGAGQTQNGSTLVE